MAVAAPGQGHFEPATYGCEIGRVEDEPVHIRLGSARQDHATDAGSEPVVELTVMPFTTWQIVKRRIKERWPGLKAVPDQNIRLLYKTVELRSDSMVDDYNMEGGTAGKPVELQYLIIDQGHDEPGGSAGRGTRRGPQVQSESKLGLYVDAQVPCTEAMRDRVHACLGALLSGIQPRLTDEGTGATYMLRDTANRHTLAVFKPKDEEAFAPQNPRGYVGHENTPGLRQGVLSTQQAAREVAAYLLDHGSFANVPETTLVHAKHPKFKKVRGKHCEKVVWKIGALQTFVETTDTAGNFAPQVFSAQDVHRIGILDVRIVNLDRNDGNLLVRHGRGNSRYELVPIDHGLSLPNRLEVFTDDIAWMSWPQAKKPFGEKEFAYIKGLSGARDARDLAQCLGVRRECLRLMEVTTKLLQIGAELGLSLFEIGTFMYRVENSKDEPAQRSGLEQVIDYCLDVALTVTGDGKAAADVSKTLAGLDLMTSRQLSAPVAPRDLGLTPQLGPSSPVSSPLSTSPTGMELEPPPHLSLDGLSESDAQEPAEPAMPASSAARASAPRETLRPLRQSYKAGGTKLRQRTSAAARVALHREGEGGDEQASVFSRLGLRGSDWPPELEKAFKRHVTSELTTVLRKRFQRSAARESSAEPEGARNVEKGPQVEASTSGDAAERTRGGAFRTSFLNAVPFASEPPRALPVVDDLEPHARAIAPVAAAAPVPRPRYVPPHLRRSAAAAEAAAEAAAAEEVSGTSAPAPAAAGDAAAGDTSSAATDAADAEAPQAAPQALQGSAEAAAGPARPKYVPPFLRRAAGSNPETPPARVPALGPLDADAAGGAAGGAGGVSAPTPALSSTAQALPSDASAGDARFGFCVHQGPRASMEDAVDSVAHLPLDSGGVERGAEFYAVYDGHNGTQTVKFVKRRLPLLISGPDAAGTDADAAALPRALRNAFAEMDAELLEHLQQFRPDPKREHGEYELSSGCVCCLALVRPAELHVANLGDCRAVLCKAGEMAPLTVDHRPDANEGERQRLQQLGVEVSSDGYLHGRIGVSRALGDWAWDAEEKCKGIICLPDVTETPLTDDVEFLLLACDGIFEKMTSREAGQIVRRRLRATGDAKAAAEALVKNAQKRNGSDNLSAIVVLFKRPPEETERAAPRFFARRPPPAELAGDASPPAAADG